MFWLQEYLLYSLVYKQDVFYILKYLGHGVILDFMVEMW